MPAIHSTTPSASMERGGTTITVTGEGFLNLPTLACRFGLANGGHSAQFVSSEHIQCTTPAESKPGKVRLEVTLNGADFTAQEVYHTFLPMATFHKLGPSMGLVSGGTPVSLEGSGFDAIGREEGTRVTCRWEMPGLNPRDVLVTRAAILTDSALTCLSPPAGQPGVAYLSVFANNVNITDDGGEDASGAMAFEYEARASTTLLAPAHGWSLGGTRINVTGDGFVDDGGLTCRFHPAPAVGTSAILGVVSAAEGGVGVVDVPAKFVSATEAHCLSPALAAVYPQDFGNSSTGVGHALVEVSNHGWSSSGSLDANRGLSFWYRPRLEASVLLAWFSTFDTILRASLCQPCGKRVTRP